MKKPTLLFVCLLFSVLCLAQVPDETNLGKTKIQVYNANQSDKDYLDNAYRWAIKSDLTSVISQEFPLIFEYRIAKKLSLEGSAAITYAYFSNDNFFNQLDNEDLDKSPETDNAFRMAVKYYPSRLTNALEGWFVGVQVFTKTTTRSYDDLTVKMGKEVFDTKTKEGLALQIGSQMFPIHNGLYEVVLGLGVANIERDFYVRSSDLFINFENIKDKKMAIYFQFHLRFGLGN
ncbi:hypothetical protein ACFFU9_09300 [Mariniflexile ostreae]|uniref:Outer membrane protein with beta-barrel domain n=1 Tax=Mariniflexile ostreae TaxID=1520892 RepID=A0ABV5FBV9_9FLAO